MPGKRKPPTIESLFPSKAGRDAADAAVDALPVTDSMARHIDVWEEAYLVVAGKSPHIRGGK